MINFVRGTNIYGGPQLSRQKKKTRGKRNNLTAKEKTSRQKEITSREKRKPRGKRNNFTAKEKNLAAKRNKFTAKEKTRGKKK